MAVVVQGRLPAGVSLGAAGELRGFPTESGTFRFSVVATNRAGTDQTVWYNLVIDPADAPPVWNLFTPPDGQQGVAYTYTFEADGFPAPTYTLVGSLPPGLALNKKTGVVSGIPTTGGSYSFQVTAANSAGSATTPTITMAIASPPVIQNQDPPDATEGDTYRYVFTALGFPKPTWTLLDGTLPPGLTLSQNGVLSGTPTLGGVYDFRVQASNSAGTATSQPIEIIIAVKQTAPVWQDFSPPGQGTTGQAYAGYQFVATGVPDPTYSIPAGQGWQLPSGLTLSPGGLLSGTPDLAGTYQFRVRATNGAGFADTPVTITIVVADPTQAPVWVLDSPPGGYVSQGYSYGFLASGKPTPTYSFQGLVPPGLTFDTQSGLLSGTPTTSGTYHFTVTATNSAGSVVTPQLTVTILGSGGGGQTPPTFDQDHPPNAPAGISYLYQFHATGTAPITYALATDPNTLPPGLAVASNGTLSGTPTATGRYVFQVSATNAAGSVLTGNITMLVTQVPQIVNGDPPDGVVGTTYSYPFTANGFPRITWSITGSVPPGLSLNSNGVLGGTPTLDGIYVFQVTATNSAGSDTTGDVTVVIAKQGSAPQWTADSPPTTGSVGSAVNYQFGASGEPAPAFRLTPASQLPPGLVLTGDGQLTGTLTTQGSFAFQVEAYNDLGTIQSPQYTFVVTVALSAPKFTNSTPPSGLFGQTYGGYQFQATGNPAPTYALAAGDTLPPGLLIAPITGNLHGTPTQEGTFTFRVVATNSQGTDTVFVTMDIDYSPQFLAANPPGGNMGVSYSYQFVVRAYPLATFAVVDDPNGVNFLPPGLTVDLNGLLSGTPSDTGTFTFQVAATNVAGTTTSSLLTVVIAGDDSPPTWTADTPPDSGVVGQSIDYFFEADGFPAPVYEVVGAGGGSVVYSMAGNATTTGATIRSMISGASSMQLAISTTLGSDGNPFSPGYIDPDGDADSLGLITHTVTGRSADTTHYAKLSPAAGVFVGDLIKFRTLPVGGPFTLKAVYGSCQFNADNNDTQLAWQDIASWQPDLMFFTGDVHYANEILGPSDPYQKHIQTYVNQFNGIPTMKRVLALCNQYIMSDDHENGGDNIDSFNSGIRAAGIYAMQQAFPMYPLADVRAPTSKRGLYGSFMIGPSIRVIFLDGESLDRSPGLNADNSSKKFIGSEQETFLRGELVKPAAVNIIITQKALLGDPQVNVSSKDKVWAYANWRSSLTTFVNGTTDTDGNPIKVYWWGGDRHFNAYCSGANNVAMPGHPTLVGSGFRANSLDLHTGENYDSLYGAGDHTAHIPVVGYLQVTISDDGAGQVSITATSRECHNTYANGNRTNPATWVLQDGFSVTETFAYDPGSFVPGADPVPEPLDTLGGSADPALLGSGLPPDLTLTTDGELAGILDLQGSYSYRVRAFNRAGSITSPVLTMDVTDTGSAPHFSGTITLPDAAVGTPYTFTFDAGGFPDPLYELVDGSVLPDGLALGDDGLLSGTPTEPGEFTLAVRATNDFGTDRTVPLTLTVTADPIFIDEDPPDGQVNVSYVYIFTASGEPRPTFSTPNPALLPPGVTLLSNGLFSGVPTTAGTYTFPVIATNDGGTDTTGSLTVVIAAAGAGTPADPEIVRASPVDGVLAQTYTYQCSAVGYPAAVWTLEDGSLPPGIALGPAGTLYGLPTRVGISIFRLRAANSGGFDLTDPIFLEITEPGGPGGGPEGIGGTPALAIRSMVLKNTSTNKSEVGWFLDEVDTFVRKSPHPNIDSYSTLNSLFRIHPMFVNPNNPLGAVGGQGDRFESLVWRPIARDFRLKRGYMLLPPVKGKYWKFEFTNLLPEHYESFVTIERTVRMFPPEIVDHWQRLTTTGGRHLPSQPGLTSALEVSSTYKYEDAIQNLLLNPANVPSPNAYSPTEALYIPDPAQYDRIKGSGWIWSFQPWHLGSSIPVWVEEGRHEYRQVVTHHRTKVGYFAGLRTLSAFRSNYITDDDTDRYIEHLYDAHNVESTTNFELVGHSGLVSTSNYAEVVGKTFGSVRNVDAIQFATQQSDANQMLTDDQFISSLFENYWFPYGDARIERKGPTNVLVNRGWQATTYAQMEAGTYQDLETRLYGSLEGNTPFAQPQGGMESEVVYPSGAGRVYVAVRVSADRLLHGPIVVELVDPVSGLVVASAERTLGKGETANIWTGYTPGAVTIRNTYDEVAHVDYQERWHDLSQGASGSGPIPTGGGFPMEGSADDGLYQHLEGVPYGLIESSQTIVGLKARVKQMGQEHDSFTVQRMSVFDDPIAWAFSPDDGQTWYDAMDIRNNPFGVMNFPRGGRFLKWRARCYQVGAKIDALVIRPWYAGILGVSAKHHFMDVSGPNLSAGDHYPDIEQDPMWQQWKDPIPSWWYSNDVPIVAKALVSFGYGTGPYGSGPYGGSS